MKELDKSLVWSRKYTPTRHKLAFVYPMYLGIIGLYFLLEGGTKRRAYEIYITSGRKVGVADSLGIDVTNTDDYPKSVYELYLKKVKHDDYVKKKDEYIDKVEDRFHDVLLKEASRTLNKRSKRGLHRKKRNSPI